jgi:hypothetical protein
LNVDFERLFSGFWSDSSTVDAAVTLSSAFTAHSRVYLHSVSDLLLLSVDALDTLLSSESFIVDSEDALLQILFPLRHPPLLHHIRWEFVSAAAITSLCENQMLFPPTESLWLAVGDRLLHPPGWMDSLIVSEFPPLFEEFRAKRFNLLWRGSRDGFTAQEFHRHCDGRANTLTLIADTNGTVFGSFTPVKWESRVVTAFGENCRKGDDSLRSFLFTLQNPHGVQPRKFAVMAERKQYAIWCPSDRGPQFGYPYELFVGDGLRGATDNFGKVYTNDTGLNGKTFFTGAESFTVKEIEVFEIAD